MKRNATISAPCKPLVLASEIDRPLLSGGPLENITRFVQLSDNEGAPIDFIPIVAVAASEAGMTALEEYRGRQKFMPIPEILFISEGRGREAASIAFVVTRSLARIAGYARGLSMQLFDLKKDREQLFESFRNLEDAFNAQSLSPVSCVFEYEPYADPRDQGVEDILSNSEITQVLPVASSGVAGFALDFKSPGRGGALKISLEVMETDVIVGAWLVTDDQVVKGWNYFALLKSCPSTAHTLRLRLAAEGLWPPIPSLGYFMSRDEFSVRSHGNQLEPLLRPLAFRIYAGVPNVSPTGVVAMFGAISDSEAQRSIAIQVPRTVLETVEMCAEVGPDIDYPLVKFNSSSGNILCHPQEFGPTVAVLRGAVPPGADWLQARVEISHPEGRPAHAAMMVLDSAKSLAEHISTLTNSEVETASENFSGWRLVKAGESPRTLHLSLSPDTKTTRDLVLISKPAGDKTYYSWLHFSHLRTARTG